MDEGGMMNGAVGVNGAGGVVGGAGNATVASPVQVPNDGVTQGGVVQGAGMVPSGSVPQGVGMMPNGPEMPQMAEMNLMPQKNVFVKNKKLWLVVGGAVLALVLVVVGVVAVVKGRGDVGEVDNGNRVVLDYKPEGYGDDPTDSVLVTVFGDRVWNRYSNDEEYSYDDATADYEKAYRESAEGVKFDVLLSYANFVFTVTGNADEAVKVLDRYVGLLNNKSDIAQYYMTIVSIYNNSGDFDQAGYYVDVLREAMQE